MLLYAEYLNVLHKQEPHTLCIVLCMQNNQMFCMISNDQWYSAELKIVLHAEHSHCSAIFSIPKKWSYTYNLILYSSTFWVWKMTQNICIVLRAEHSHCSAPFSIPKKWSYTYNLILYSCTFWVWKMTQNICIFLHAEHSHCLYSDSTQIIHWLYTVYTQFIHWLYTV